MRRSDGEPDFPRIAAEVRARVRDPRAGLYGPSSMTWRLLREPALLLGGGRALLLQIAHPAVAAAVEAHSDFRRHPLERARRTFDAMFRIAFADLDGALDAAGRIHRRHEPVHGVVGRPDSATARPYRASDPELLLWVHATLVDTVLEVYARAVAPLSPDDAARYYEEQKLTAFLLGIPDSIVPPDLAAFGRYFRSMVEGPALVVGEVAQIQCRDLLSQPPSLALRAVLGDEAALPSLLDTRGLRWLVSRSARMLTAGFLPPPLRAPFGMPWSATREHAFNGALALLRALQARLPPSLRRVPSYPAALARASGT